MAQPTQSRLSYLAGMFRFPASFLRNLGWQYVANAGAAVLGALHQLAVASSIGATDYGLFALGFAFSSLVFGCFDPRLQEVCIRYFSEFMDSRKPESLEAMLRLALWVDVVTRALGFVVLLLLAHFASRTLLKVEDGETVLLAYALWLFGARLGNAPAVGIVRVLDRFDVHAKVVVFDWSMRLAAVLVVIALGKASLMLLILVSGAAAVIANITLVVFSMRLLKSRNVPVLGGPMAALSPRRRELRAFMASSYSISIVDSVVRDLDTTIVGWFLPLDSVAVYRMAKNFALMVWKAGDPIFFVVMPELSRMVQNNDIAAIRTFVFGLARILFAGAIVLLGVAVALVPLITEWFLGPGFERVPIVFLFSSGWIVVSLPIIWTHALAYANGKPHLQLSANIIGNALAAVLLVVLTPLFGVIGAATSVSIGYAVTFLAALAFLRIQRLV